MAHLEWPKVPKKSEADGRADLTAVHWSLSFTSTQMPKTEAKTAYINYGKVKRTGAFELGDDLKASHIDLSVGQSRTGKHWQSSQSSEMFRNAAQKFGCAKPEGLGHLGEELRKSSISFSDRDEGSAFPQSEQKSRFITPAKVEQAPNVAETVGKDLRASHIDIANGANTECKHWKSMLNLEMEKNAKEKFECRKPTAFEHLSKELRKSSVPLGNINRDDDDA
eukprot:CAMPEP_0115070530 /NCGR_PEP_ID=MMETSP0227-20121206/13165_1 /TAXON_ID=89957 /ORGANISM="Polarella glacialis, Strain CCMP 1383" /LENGTH=222 /DNA_ID=CAMNT_0002457055 /DNA_START=158 /DNA_END=826 /DNA_ORIENTATION=+